MAGNRPLVFVDLDDTLFQTARKMGADTPRVAATLDVNSQPNGYMNPVQQSFVQWLLGCADVVPVTARSVEAYSRVQLAFTQGAVCSHGGVILTPDGQIDAAWHQHMSDALAAYQQRLPQLCETALAIGQELQVSLRGWVVEEQGLQNYVVIKHNDGLDSDLHKVRDLARERGLLEGMHVHGNGNNLAFLPDGLAKRLAVEHWLQRDRLINGERPVLGFGDSITDLGFMDLCTFWATPAQSQLAKAVEGALHA